MDRRRLFPRQKDSKSAPCFPPLPAAASACLVTARTRPRTCPSPLRRKSCGSRRCQPISGIAARPEPAPHHDQPDPAWSERDHVPDARPRVRPGTDELQPRMRNIVFNTSLSAANAHALNHMFSSIMISVQAPNPGPDELVTGVNQLVSQVDTASINPVFLATNDNAYILQLGLVIGPANARAPTPTITKGTGHQHDSWRRDHAALCSDLCRQL